MKILFPIANAALLLLTGLLMASCTAPRAVMLSPSAPSTPARFPEMTVQNLAGKSTRFPSGFPGERTLLLIAFEREQQETLDEWNRRLGLSRPGGAAWLELPVIPDPGVFLRWFIDTGMKSGIPAPEIRSRVYTIYTPRETFVDRLGLPNCREVHLAAADRAGRILGFVSGPWTPDRESKLILLC